MSLKRQLTLIFLGLIVTACTPSPVSFAENYLSLLKAGKLDRAASQLCNPQDEHQLQRIKSFRISTSEDKRGEYTFLEYKSLLVEVKTNQFSPDDNVFISMEVWNSDKFFEEYIEPQKRINSSSAYSQIIRGVPEFQRYYGTLPSRDDFNKNRQCVRVFIMP